MNNKKIGILGFSAQGALSKIQRGVVIVDSGQRHSKTLECNKSTAVLKVYLNKANQPEKSFSVDINNKIVNCVPFEKGWLLGFTVTPKNIRVGYQLTLKRKNECFTIKSKVVKIEK